MGNKDERPEEGLVHDEVEIEDFEYDIDTDSFKYPCPCGDEFTVSRVSISEMFALFTQRNSIELTNLYQNFPTQEDLMNGEKYAKCPSCSLIIQVIYNIDDLESIVEIKSAQKDSAPNKSSSLRVIN